MKSGKKKLQMRTVRRQIRLEFFAELKFNLVETKNIYQQAVKVERTDLCSHVI